MSGGSFARSLATLYDSATSGNGAAVFLDGRYYQTVSFTVHVVAVNAADSLQLQGSIDGSNWFNIGSAITTAQGVNITTPARAYRIVKTGTAGVATVLIY